MDLCWQSNAVEVAHRFSSKEQASFNFIAAVNICSDFGDYPRKKSLIVSIVSPSICHEEMGLDAMILVFCMLSFKPASSLFSFTFIKRLFSSSSFCHKRGVICISEVIDISPYNLIPACISSTPAFHMMYIAYKLNKQRHYFADKGPSSQSYGFSSNHVELDHKES